MNEVQTTKVRRDEVELAIQKIQADGRAQPRVRIEQFIVDDYADAMQAGAEFPPVVVFHDGDVYWLADGFHRHLAAQQAGSAPRMDYSRKGEAS